MNVTLDVSLESGNAAFEGNAAIETARILRALADSLEQGREGRFHLVDVNGNLVGKAFFEVWEGEN
jgi:hypothetical protein